MRYHVQIDGQSFEVEVEERPGRAPLARLIASPGSVDASLTVEIDAGDLVRRDDDEWLWKKGAASVELFWGDGARHQPMTVRGLEPGSPLRKVVKVESERERAFRAGGTTKRRTEGGLVRSPMPGKLTKLCVKVGDRVRAGTPVAIVEAMKMENELVANADGVVTALPIPAGSAVDAGAVLCELAAT